MKRAGAHLVALLAVVAFMGTLPASVALGLGILERSVGGRQLDLGADVLFGLGWGVLGFLPVSILVARRPRAYWPLVGLLLGVALAVAWLRPPAAATPSAADVGLALAEALFVGLGFLLYRFIHSLAEGMGRR
jgi:hypothetical protein